MKAETRAKFINLIDAYGEDDELYTFEACSNNGIGLDGSTIDKIDIRADGQLIFVFNENENDFAMESEFSESGLEEFANGLEEVFYEEEKESVKEVIDEIMMPVISDAWDRSEFVDNVVKDVVNDMVETADDDWNDDDVRISLARVLLTLSGMGA